MQDLILKNMSSFIEMDPKQTVELCDQWFEGNYFKMVEAIDNHTNSTSLANEMQFKFITTVIELKQATIIEQYHQSMITGFDENTIGPKKEYKNLIIKLVDILCEKKYRKIAKDYVIRDYFPINESLAICEKKGVKDACAILYKRKGEFK